MSAIYLLAKFAQEAIVLELFFISVLCLALFGFYLFKRRRYGVAKAQIPDQVVKAFIVEILALSESFKQQLFGSEALGKGTANFGAALQGLAAHLPQGTEATASADPALKAQLADALGKQSELTKAITLLQSEKAALEEKLKKAASVPADAAGAAPGDNKALQEALDKIKTLEAKLGEYEVIEDDLANLKKFQQENKQLKATIEQLKKGGATEAAPQAGTEAPAAPPAAADPTPPAAAAAQAPVPTPAPAEAAPAPAAPTAAAPSPLASAEEARATEEAKEGFEEIAAKVGESIAPPAADGVKDPAVAAKVQTTAPSTDAPAPAAAAPAKSETKGDSDLLSEFEKMLSS